MAFNSALLVLSLVLLGAAPSALAQELRPARDGNNGTFNDFSARDYRYQYDISNFENEVTTSTAPANAAAGVSQRVFALEPCTLFAPHFHPASEELFLGVRGRLELTSYINNRLVRNVINRDTAVIVPQNTLHTFVNNDCEEGAVITALNAAPGFGGYYDIPTAITDNRFGASSFAELADTAANATLDATRAFIQLTNNCQRKCLGRAISRTGCSLAPRDK